MNNCSLTQTLLFRAPCGDQFDDLTAMADKTKEAEIYEITVVTIILSKQSHDRVNFEALVLQDSFREKTALLNHHYVKEKLTYVGIILI